MADKARKQTDKELNKLEREIYELYATSQNEIAEKWREYMSSHKKPLDKAHNELEDAKKSGDKDAIKTAQEQYERAVRNVTLNDNRYKAMLNETTAKLANVNQTALDYVNNDMPKIYTLNYNAFGDEKIDGYSFALVNERAVANLVQSNKIELPYKKVDVSKDKAWNAKNINSQLIQGILQGESISKISARLQNVTDMNRSSSIRNARTMVTGAENKGRQDSFEKAAEDGIIMKRRWVATNDERTRAWHSDLDGVEVGVDEPWENEYGEIMYPGDPSADPCNVYNCRCSIRAVVAGFKWNEETEKSVVKDTKKPDETQNEMTYNRETFNEEAERQGLDLTADDIDDYVSSSYGNLKLGDKISEFIDNAPEEMKVHDTDIYRGLYFNSEQELNNFLKAHSEGDVIESRRDGLSWTTDMSVAEEFSTSASEYSVILVNSDDEMNAISIKDISDTPSSSSEVLYSSSSDFLVEEIEKHDDKIYIYVTEAVLSKKKY